MAAGWSVLDALNKSSKAAVDETPKARFRTRDISIRKMYSNDRNFYSMTGIEKLAQEILAVGLVQNMVVAYEPCERGEYKIIAGERRWRALKLLLEKGYEEFEIATCQIKTPKEEHEETVQLIIANAYRDKTVMDVLEEERKLKEALQYMKENGIPLQGYTLDSGRLRDVIADIMKMTGTKIAQIESINNRLIPEFTQELKEGRLTFSAAYEISGMDEERQQEMLEQYKQNGTLTWKDVRAAKQAAEEAWAAQQIEGQMTYTEDYEGQQEDEEKGMPDEALVGEEDDADEYEEPHPERVTSICYGCLNYSGCSEARSDVRRCDQYINKAEAEKTDEQRYNEEQDAIDRETKKKLREKQEEECLSSVPESGKQSTKSYRASSAEFRDITERRKPYMILRNEGQQVGDKMLILEFSGGKATGASCVMWITYIDTSKTSSAISDGFCVVGIVPDDEKGEKRE